MFQVVDSRIFQISCRRRMQLSLFNGVWQIQSEALFPRPTVKVWISTRSVYLTVFPVGHNSARTWKHLSVVSPSAQVRPASNLAFLMVFPTYSYFCYTGNLLSLMDFMMSSVSTRLEIYCQTCVVWKNHPTSLLSPSSWKFLWPLSPGWLLPASIT